MALASRRDSDALHFSGTRDDIVGKRVGRATVLRKPDNMPVEILITHTTARKNSYGQEFILYLPAGHGHFEELGHLVVHESIADDDVALHIDTIDTRKGNQRFKNLGRVLQQAAVEVAIVNGISEVNLTSSDIGGGNPIGFHFKGGWRSRFAGLNEAIRKFLSGDGNSGSHFDALTGMHLPGEELKHYQGQIAKNRLLTDYSLLPELAANNEAEWLHAVFHICDKRRVALPEAVIRTAKSLCEKYPYFEYDPRDLERKPRKKT